MAKIDIPVYEKPNLTVEEAAIYFSIGENKLRELTDRSDCNFVLFVGRKRLRQVWNFFMALFRKRKLL